MHDGHEHGIHEHESGAVTADQAVALLQYMLEHNRQHAGELLEMSHKLEAMGFGDAACLLDAAVDDFSSGNNMLESALENLTKEV